VCVCKSTAPTLPRFSPRLLLLLRKATDNNSGNRHSTSSPGPAPRDHLTSSSCRRAEACCSPSTLTRDGEGPVDTIVVDISAFAVVDVFVEETFPTVVALTKIGPLASFCITPKHYIILTIPLDTYAYQGITTPVVVILFEGPYELCVVRIPTIPIHILNASAGDTRWWAGEQQFTMESKILTWNSFRRSRVFLYRNP
jgi:hypothetical protein